MNLVKNDLFKLWHPEAQVLFKELILKQAITKKLISEEEFNSLFKKYGVVLGSVDDYKAWMRSLPITECTECRFRSECIKSKFKSDGSCLTLTVKAYSLIYPKNNYQRDEYVNYPIQEKNDVQKVNTKIQSNE